MTTVTLSLDPVVLSDPTTYFFLNIASNISFRLPTGQTLFSTADELLAGIQGGELFILQAQTCRFLVSVTKEEDDSKDQANFDSQDKVKDHFDSQDSGVCLLPCDAVASASNKQASKDGEVTSSIYRLVEAGINTLLIGRKAVEGIETISTMRTPTLIRLAPEVFNTSYLSSLIARSHLLPALSSVFSDLDHIESLRLRRHNSVSNGNVSDSHPNVAQDGTPDSFGQRIWRLMRTHLPAFDETKSSQQQRSEPATRIGEIPELLDLDAMTPYEDRAEDELSISVESGFVADEELETNQARHIQDSLSDTDMDFGQNTPSSWMIDESLCLSSPPPTFNLHADRSELGDEREENNDEGRYPEDPISDFGETHDSRNVVDLEAHGLIRAIDLMDTSRLILHSTHPLASTTSGGCSDWSNASVDFGDEEDFGIGYFADGSYGQSLTSPQRYSDWQRDEGEGLSSEVSFQEARPDHLPDDHEIHGEPELGHGEDICQGYTWPNESFSENKTAHFEEE
ncbi:hypothetical protein CORC01_05493 [Colletotrichum orchidophilum]|uniref:Uncharacterized protein n=1 Tax=Colletotrichum orchidophilum TaxID=1209926 RepID=A0A1G4BD13_9PEZI|nr:uncharacterized protein CORC01_05493 [Colletotrichum orchidophilum]OHE99212.1 hypothetical protein CORC01_05493 [Colletotrichum orchidophilum]